MDLNRLEEFVIIARTHSIKKAAEELHLSPATLSSRLNKFEESLGTPLFSRTGHHLSLTNYGTHLLIDAQEITEKYTQIKQELLYMNESTLHQLRIGIMGSGLPFYLGPFLDITNKLHPDLQLDILDDACYSIFDSLLSGELDLFFSPATSDMVHDDIVKYALTTARQYVILPEDHPLSGQNSISIKELDNEHFILYPITKESCLRDFQLKNLEASGIHYSIYESRTTPSFYKLLVPIGKGIVLTPNPMVSDIPNTVCIPVNDIACPPPVSLFYSKKNARPEVRRFISDFLKYVKEQSSHEH